MMTADVDWARLWSTAGALDHTATRVCVGMAAVAVAGMLGAGPVLARVARPEVARDIRVRTLTWAVLAPVTFGAILWSPLTLLVFAGLLGLLCHREFARVTGLHREHVTCGVVSAGIVASTVLAVAGVEAATLTLAHAGTLVALCLLNVLPDRPSGYIRRVALGAGSFMLFGVGLGRLGHFALLKGLPDYRALVCVLVSCVQLNDVFAYCCGRALSSRVGGGKWFAVTSPGKTAAGHVGAVLLTGPLSAWLLWLALSGTAAGTAWHVAALSLVIAVGGQLGDLVISSVKRDVGVKDMGALLPGHGGVLDRCNSLLLVVPVAYHIVRQSLATPG